MKMDQVNLTPGTRVAKAAPFILSHVFLERYSTAGIASVLVLFLNQKIGYDQNASTAVYHMFVFFSYSFSLLGSILADSWWGQFKTLVWMSLVFSGGAAVVAMAAIDALNLPLEVLASIGLVIITIGTGCIKPCSNTFGGDQSEPNEVHNIALFFSINYFVFNCGSIISRFVTPLFRSDIKCFGADNCYPLAFGIPGLMMILATLILLAGRKRSVCNKPNGNMFVKFCGCIWHAIYLKYASKTPSKGHWLDKSKEKYGEKMVMETKMILNVLAIFPPLPLFWALFDQQGSRWVFQSTRMNGNFGFFTIKAGQFSIVNPLMAMFLIPSFEYCFYPIIAKIGVKTPLQKAILGGVFAGLSFIASAIVELEMHKHGHGPGAPKLHMVWLLPQFFLMTVGEILITVPMTQFSYTEAPKSMKSVLQAFRLITMASGNLAVSFITGSRVLRSRAHESFMFAGLMFFDMLVFGILAKRYKFVDEDCVKN